MFTPQQLQSPSIDITAGSPMNLGEPYVTSPKVFEIPDQPTDFRVAVGWLCFILIVACVLRALLFLLGPATMAEHTPTATLALQTELATHLADRDGFVYATATGNADRQKLLELREQAGHVAAPTSDGLLPEAYETPGYPAVLAAIQLTNTPTKYLIAAQCALSALCAALVFGIGYRVFKKPGPALLAAAIVAVHPMMIISPLGMNGDVLFLTLALFGIWAASRRVSGWAIVGGFSLGLAVLVQPITIFLGPAVALWLVMTERKAATLGAAAMLTLASIIPPGAWMARNAYHGFGPRLSLQQTVGLAHTAAQVTAVTINDRNYQPSAEDLSFQVAEGSSRDAISALNAGSLRVIKDHPAELGQVMLHNALKLMTGHAVPQLYEAMGLTYHNEGVTESLIDGQAVLPPPQAQDKAASYFALGWMGINALLALATAVGLALMAARRFGAALLLTVAALLLATLMLPTFGIPSMQPLAITAQALIVGAILARGPKRIKPPKTKKEKKNKHQKRADKVFDLEDDAPEQAPAMEGRPI